MSLETSRGSVTSTKLDLELLNPTTEDPILTVSIGTT